nr:AMP-binding protein [Nitrospirota bacterium]
MIADAFGSALQDQLSRQRDKLFCAFSADGTCLTYEAAHDRVAACAEVLRKRGIGPGSRVAIQLPTSAELVVHLLATMHVGAFAVPMEPMAHPDTLAVLMKILEPHLVASPSQTAGATAQLSPECGVSWTVSESASPSSETQQGCLGIFTSGSTGVPKCALLSVTNLLNGVQYVREAHGVGGEDTAACCLPLSHINGIVTTLLTPLMSGGSVVFVQGSFSPTHFVNLLRQYGVTWFSAVPTHYRMLLDLRETPTGLEACRFGRSASAPLHPNVQERFEALFRIPVIETMGLTECAGQVFANPMVVSERKFGSVGRPVGNEAEVVDEQGNPALDGQTGEIRVRGPNVMLGYFRSPEATAEVLRDGWLYTGDIGYRDSDGFFHITGRKKLIAIFSGINISLVAVEQAAKSLPFVKDAAAVGCDDPLFGEVIDLYFTGGGADPAKEYREVQAQARRLLPHHLALRNVRQIDEIPRSASGKVLRYRLAGIEAKR